MDRIDNGTLKERRRLLRARLQSYDRGYDDYDYDYDGDGGGGSLVSLVFSD